MKVERYVRVTERITEGLVEPIEVVAGVALSPRPVSEQYNRLRAVIRKALSPSALRNYSDSALNASVELAILNEYPDRTSFFIEVGRGKMDEYVQVYQP